jgi:hypothetical protein
VGSEASTEFLSFTNISNTIPSARRTCHGLGILACSAKEKIKTDTETFIGDNQRFTALKVHGDGNYLLVFEW